MKFLLIKFVSASDTDFIDLLNSEYFPKVYKIVLKCNDYIQQSKL